MARILTCSLLFVCTACTAIVNNKLDDKPLDLCTSDDDCNEYTGACEFVCDPEDDAADDYGCLEGEPEPGALCGENPLQRCRPSGCSMLTSCNNNDDCECNERCLEVGEGLEGCVPLGRGETRPDEEICNNIVGGLGICFMEQCRALCDDNRSCRCTEDCVRPGDGSPMLCAPVDVARRLGACLTDSGMTGVCVMGECR